MARKLPVKKPNLAAYAGIGCAALLLGALIILFMAAIARAPQEAAIARPEEAATAPRVSEPREPKVESWRFERGEFDTLHIVGTARNNSRRQLSYAQVQFNLYDKAGAQVDSTMDAINNWEPGVVWKFDCSILSENVASAKFKGISAF